MAVIETHRAEDSLARMQRIGALLAEQVREATAASGVDEHVQVLGRPANLVYTTLDADGQRSQAFRTLFLAELLERGILAPSFVVSAATTEDDVTATAEAVHEAGLVYRKALDHGIDGHLAGRPVRPALRPRR